MKNKLISIIVPVYNRAGETADFLESFTQQTNEDFEIIVVDDGSEDDLKTVIEKYSSKLDLSYYFQQNKGPGEARNNGMRNANGDYYVFIDSDCTVPKNYIENLKSNLQKTDADAFGGPDTCHKSFPPFLKAVNYSMTSFLGTGGTRGSKGKSVAKYYPRSFNMGVHKKVYQKIGGMNDLRHGQDMDFSNRIHKAGFTVRYFDDIPVFHKRRTNLRKFFKQVFNWGLTRINLGRIDKKMLKPVHFLPAAAIASYFILAVFSFFSRIAFRFFLLENLAVMLICLAAFIESSIKNRSLKVGFLSIITLLTQVLAYGLGMITGLIKWPLTAKGKWITGFTKKYYK